METFLWIYIPMICASLGFAFLALHVKQKIFSSALWTLSALPPIAIAAFRYDNGADWKMYYHVYRVIQSTGDFVSVKSIEVGFKWLIQACQVFSGSPLAMFISCAVLIVAFYYRGCWCTSDNVLLSLLLFYATGTYFDSLNGIRQYLAAAILFWAFQFIIRRELKNYVIAVCCAALFHYSALIMFPFYFVCSFRFTLKRAVAVIASAWFGGTAAYRLVSYVLQFTRYRFYLTSIEYEIMPTEASTLYTVLLTALAFVLVLRYRRLKLSPKNELMLNVQVLTVCTALLSWTVPLMWRVQYYFLPLEMLVVPNLLKLIPSRFLRNAVASAVVAMYAAIVLYGMLENNWFDCIPWNFYFNYA